MTTRAFSIALAVLLMAANAAHASADKIGVSAQYPSPSPDGGRIVFSADFDGPSRLWVSAINGSGLRKISRTLLPDVAESQPAWAPDGSTIAYVTVTETGSSIWLAQADGGHPRQLTSGTGFNAAPSWSPDSSKIAFVSDRAGSRDVWVMNADGSAPRRLTTLPGPENRPSFSPAGNQLVFSYANGGFANLYIVNIDGTGLRQVTNGPFNDSEPNWGQRGIVFSSNRSSASGRWMLWSVLPTGAEMKKIGEVAGHDPVWLADGNILFTDEPLNSRSLGSLSKVSSAGGAPQVLVDVQGFLHPIDIRPTGVRNHINPRSLGRVTVAILGSASFDVSRINVGSITFGRTGAEGSLDDCDRRLRDLNGDGFPDLGCRFVTRRAQFGLESTEGVLRFLDRDEKPYEGRDKIVIVPDDDPEDLN